MKASLFAAVFAMMVGVVAAAGCSSSSSSGGGGTPTCSASGTSTCAGGAAIQVCATKAGDGSCASVYYTVGSQTFNCNSCTDTTKCSTDAVSACLGDAGVVTLPDAGGGTPDSGNTTTGDAAAE